MPNEVWTLYINHLVHNVNMMNLLLESAKRWEFSQIYAKLDIQFIQFLISDPDKLYPNMLLMVSNYP